MRAWDAARDRFRAATGGSAANPRGPVEDPRLTGRLREICAIQADGRVAVASGYETDPELRALLMELRRDGTVQAAALEETVPVEEIAGIWADGRESPANYADPALVATARELLASAAAAHASDLIFEVDSDECRVSVIVLDRKEPLGRPLSREEGERLTGYLFFSKAEGSAQTSYQRGQFQGFAVQPTNVPLPPNVSALRCQRGPHEPSGDHMFVRLFYRDTLDRNATLESLGFSPAQAAVFARIRASRRGGIFLGGSTGDGKSTTLAVNLTLQQREAGGRLNLVTVEDPVEYPIPGAVQIAVPTTGSGDERASHYARALMHFCRVHPAAGMVSEIRDADAARQVLQFIDTGHQVWTTIHVHSANGILFRLLDMGVSAAEVCKPGNVALLMKQTLVPRLCPDCSSPEPPEETPEWFAFRAGEHRFRNPDGCGSCRRSGAGEIASRAWAGYVDQTAVAEMIRPDAGYLDRVRERDPAGAQEHWIRELRGVPIGSQVAAMVRAGAADPFDAIRKGAEPGDALPGQPVELVAGAAS